jgi:hypothetical protein
LSNIAIKGNWALLISNEGVNSEMSLTAERPDVGDTGVAKNVIGIRTKGRRIPQNGNRGKVSWRPEKKTVHTQQAMCQILLDSRVLPLTLNGLENRNFLYEVLKDSFYLFIILK